MAVVCVTCGSRLKVVDQRLIGTIANCPKCGAMVEIKSAATASADHGPAAESPAVDKSAAERPSAERPAAIQSPVPTAYREPAQQLPQPPPERPHLAVGHETGIDSEALTQSAVAFPQGLDASYDDDPYSSPIPDDADDPYSPRLTDVLAGAGAIDPTHLPADPAQVWQSEASRRVSQLGWIITLGLFGLITAAVAFVQFARSWSGPAAQITAQAGDAQPPLAPDAAGDGADTGRLTSQDGLGDEAPEDLVAVNSLPLSGDEDSEAPREQRSATEAAASTTAASDRSTPVQAAEPTPEPPLPQGPSQPQPTASAPPPPDPIAPSTGVVAEAAPAAAAPAADAPPSAQTLDNLPPGLQKYVQLLNPSTADIGTPQIFDTPPTIDSIQLDAAAGDDIDEEAASRPAIDIPKALAMRLAVDNAGVSLAELMLLVGQLTGVPVEVELISLDLAGISAQESFKTPAGWMSVQQWLDQALAPAGMAAEIADERVLVYATPQKLIQESGTALKLDDFGDAAAEVALWVRPVVGPIGQGTLEDGVEDSWAFLDDEQRIDLPRERSALIRTMLAVEAARMIHGLPARLPRWQTQRWMGPWVSTPAADAPASDQPANMPPEPRPPAGDEDAGAPPQATALTGQTVIPPGQSVTVTNQAATDTSRTGTGAGRDGEDPHAIADWPIVAEGTSGPPLDSPRTVAGLLRQLAAENQVAILVAWRDAMRHQLYPADLAMPFNDNLPAGAMIDELIGQSGLQARDAGSGVWWIGSQAQYDRYEVISWLSVTDGGGEAAAKQLAEALGVEDPSALPVTWDQRTLLVRAPRYIARQLARFGH
jgi:hypothetical protein